MTVLQVADKLGVTKSCVEKWIQRKVHIGPLFVMDSSGQYHINGRRVRAFKK